MELCRVCLGKDNVMFQLFDCNNTDESILLRIQFCTGVMFTKMDTLPSQICTSCLKELHTAHKFKTKCLNSDYMYRNLIKVKQERGTENETIPNNVVNLNNEIKESYENNNDNDIFFNDHEDSLKNEMDSGIDYNMEIGVKIEDHVISDSNTENIKVRLKNKILNRTRGPYKKTGKPARLRKLKFRRLCCEVCDIKFMSKKDSDDHKKQFHNEPQQWICEICGKAFSHRSSQLSHMRAHAPPRYACAHCDYSTANKHDLTKHLRIHSDVKSYVCAICASAYRTSSNLHAHVRLKHERVRRHACPLCARRFYDRTKLNRHLDSHNDVKRYSCEVCHACFTRRCYWKKHLLKQHDITIPSCRPGRRKAEVMLREMLTP